MLSLYRRHSPPCPHTSRRYRRCNCPIWVQGSLAGDYVRRSLDLRAWGPATNLVRDWEELGRVDAVRKLVPSIAEAVGQYLTDCRARLRPASVKKYRSLTETHLLRFCAARGFTRLEQLDVVALRDFRNSWTFAPVTQSKNLEYLRGFMKFCMLSGWIPTNPAVSVEAPHVPHVPTLPFSESEIQKLLKGCAKDRVNGAKLRALILLLRYSGLRISDAVSLKRSDVRYGRVFLYQEKTGTPVHVPIPPIVALHDLVLRAGLARIDRLTTPKVFWMLILKSASE